MFDEPVILFSVDALGNPTGFHLTQGQACDLDGSDVLLPQIKAEALLADRAYDADDRVILPLKAANIEPVIPPKANRKDQRDYDEELYKSRYLIRAIATRYDKRAAPFLGAIYLAASLIWLN